MNSEPTLSLEPVDVPPRKTRVALVDDDNFVLRILSDIISAGGCEVVGQAKDGDQAVDLVLSVQPDVVIMDVRMERVDGITATYLLKALPTPPGVIALTSFDSEATILDAVSAGVDGFLAKDSDPSEFVNAIQRVASGEGWLSPRATRVVIHSARNAGVAAPGRSGPSVNDLAPREREAVTWLVREGSSNADIAQQMFISETSVKTHLSNAAAKLRAKNRTHLAVLAVQAGVLN